jgi:hypothetical protein
MTTITMKMHAPAATILMSIAASASGPATPESL